MLPLAQKYAFRVLDYGFFFMKPFPITWTHNYTKLQSTKSKTAIYHYKLFMLLTVLNFVGCTYVSATHLLLRPRENYKGILILHALGATFCGVSILFTIIAWANPHSRHTANNLLQIYGTLRQSKMQNTKSFENLLKRFYTKIHLIHIFCYSQKFIRRRNALVHGISCCY